MTRPVGRPATTSPARGPARTWRGRTALLLIGVLSLNACYSTRPVAGPPAPETRLVVDLNDRGRVAYGERIGSSVREVEGIVESASDSAYVLRISTVRYLNGRTDKWAGERFSFAPANLANVRQREFSRSRTTVLGAVLAAALTAAILAVSLVGSSTDGSRGPPGGGNGGEL